MILQETKRETWDRRFVGGVWKGRNKDWLALPVCEAFRGIVIIWNSNKFNCTKKVLGSFLVIVKLNSDEKGSIVLANLSLWSK